MSSLLFYIYWTILYYIYIDIITCTCNSQSYLPNMLKSIHVTNKAPLLYYISLCCVCLELLLIADYMCIHKY